MILILGGSGSGKSEYGEQLLMRLSSNMAGASVCRRFYIATMQVYDEELQRKVDRHKRIRADRGFTTIECPVNIGDAISMVDASSIAILECMSNLVANEMFREGGAAADAIIDAVLGLDGAVGELIVISNDVFRDGWMSEENELTNEYIRRLGYINEALAAKATEVYEVVAGIGVRIKGD